MELWFQILLFFPLSLLLLLSLPLVCTFMFYIYTDFYWLDFFSPVSPLLWERPRRYTYHHPCLSTVVLCITESTGTLQYCEVRYSQCTFYKMHGPLCIVFYSIISNCFFVIFPLCGLSLFFPSSSSLCAAKCFSVQKYYKRYSINLSF